MMINTSFPKKKLDTQGFSLIELLVGMVISLLVGSVAIGYLFSSSQLYSAKNSQDLIQENNRFAVDIVSNYLLNSGQVNTEKLIDNLKDPLFLSDICSANLKDNITDIGTISCNRNNQNNVVGPAGNTITYSSDRLAIQTITDQDFVSCSGQTVSATSVEQPKMIVTVFWAGDIDADGISSLYCQTYTSEFSFAGVFDTYEVLGSPIPLVDGIQMFQYQLGIDNDNDNDVDLYQDYDNVTNANRKNVKTIRFGFLTSSGQTVQRDINNEVATSKTYNLFDGEHTTAATDKELRLTSSYTIFLPNESS